MKVFDHTYEPLPSAYYSDKKAHTARADSIFFLLFISALLISLSSTLAYPSSTDIHYVYPDELILVSKVDKNSVFDNPLNRVLEELFSKAKLNWNGYEYPAARMFQTLDDGIANFAVLPNSSILDECCIVGKMPIVSTELRVYHKKNVAPATGITSLRGKHVITLRGYSYGPFKNFIADPVNNITKSPTGTHISAFAMLNKGRAKYLLDYNHPSILVLRNQPIHGLQFETINKIDLYMVLHKNYPNANRVMEKLENIIQTIDVDGILSLPTE